ncbi:MAG: prenyltransferase/squalene oxidase repeat-containing protein [Thermoplasmata archaeon]
MGSADQMLDGHTRKRLIEFVFSMENASGGFNYPRCTPASIEETYFGLSILEGIGFDYRNPKTVSYLDSIVLRKNTSLKHLYQVLASYRILCLDNKMKDIDRILISLDANRITRLADLYYYALLCKGLNRELNIPKKWQNALVQSMSKGQKHISTCQRCVTICEMAEIDCDKESIISWVQKSQNPDGGFGFYPGTTSYLENVWAALDCLEKLRAKPLSPGSCAEFVMSCASRAGGFGRQKQALPTLEHSFMAVESLRILDSIVRSGNADVEGRSG